jgi:REP element-mobilizing transposase RayT
MLKLLRGVFLYAHVDIDVKQLLKQIADDNNIKIMEMASDKDHLHLLIECTPQHYIPIDSYLKNILNLNNGFGVGIFGIRATL